VPDEPDIAGITRPFTDEEVERIIKGILAACDESEVEELERLAEL
jgi:hypothetical protein